MPFPKVEIRPRRSMTVFALLSIFMVVASYVFVIALATACVYLPYWLMMSTSSPNGQLILVLAS